MTSTMHKDGVITSMQKRFQKLIKIIDMTDSVIQDKMVLINFKRLFYVAIIALPLSLIEIIIFMLNSDTGNVAEIEWRTGIIIAQLFVFLMMGIFGTLAYFLKKEKQPNLFMRIFQYVAIIMIQLAGIIIVSIDQMVVSSITPYVIVLTITGAIFLIRPLAAATIYLASFFVFYYAMGATQFNQSLLLSNRVNGLFAFGIGICLSYILWRTNSVNLQQAEYIKGQKIELEAKNKQLEQLAFYDPLTGLFNRRYFEEQLRNEISRISRYGNESCVAIMDIDFFKVINDTYGHPVGDQLLKRIALNLNRQLRKTDILSRWGGEEFIILLPNTSLLTAQYVAEKIRGVIGNELFIVEDRKIHITVSFGVALLINDSTDTFEYSYMNADKALYNAKQNGRNRVEIA